MALPDRSKLLLSALILAASASGCVVLIPMTDQESAARYAREYTADGLRPARPSYAPDFPVRTVPRSASAAVQRYLVQLRDPNPALRAGAASSLGMLGTSARDATPALRGALGDRSKNVRRAAVKALAHIEGADAVPDIASRLHDPDVWVVHSAKGSLREIGTPEALRALRGR